MNLLRLSHHLSSQKNTSLGWDCQLKHAWFVWNFKSKACIFLKFQVERAQICLEFQVKSTQFLIFQVKSSQSLFEIIIIIIIATIIRTIITYIYKAPFLSRVHRALQLNNIYNIQCTSATISSSHLSLNREGCWGTTDDFATNFLHFPLFSTALWDLANSRPVHSLMLSSHLFLCLPCLLPPVTVPCKMVLARPDERETWPYHCSLHLSGGLHAIRLPAGSWHGLSRW